MVIGVWFVVILGEVCYCVIWVYFGDLQVGQSVVFYVDGKFGLWVFQGFYWLVYIEDGVCFQVVLVVVQVDLIVVGFEYLYWVQGVGGCCCQGSGNVWVYQVGELFWMVVVVQFLLLGQLLYVGFGLLLIV